MNALLWMATAIIVGWLLNMLGAEDDPEAMALTIGLAIAGALLCGWMVAPAGGALPLRQGSFSAGASIAAAIGAVLLPLAVRGLLRGLATRRRRPATAPPRALGVARTPAPSQAALQAMSWADAGPDTVPSGRSFAPDGDAPARIAGP